MSKGATIRVKGLDVIEKKIRSLPANVAQEADAIFHAAANGMANEAAANAPKDEGILWQEISLIPVKQMHYQVVSATDYAPFIEFGTGSRVSIPPGLESYAAQFKGSKSSSVSVKEAIFKWCERKEIEKGLWYPIYISIMTKGIHPHPYFFPPYYKAEASLKKDLKQMMQRVTKR